MDDTNYDFATRRPTETFYERTQELIDRLDPATTEIHFVAGGREFKDREAMTTHLTRVAQDAAKRGKRVVLVEGGAKGADSLAGQVAQELGMNVIEFPANWRPDGKTLRNSAGFERNELMAEFLDAFKRGFATRADEVVEAAPAAAAPAAAVARRASDEPTRDAWVQFFGEEMPSQEILQERWPEFIQTIGYGDGMKGEFAGTVRQMHYSIENVAGPGDEIIPTPRQIESIFNRYVKGIPDEAPKVIGQPIFAEAAEQATREFRVSAALFPGGKGTDAMGKSLRSRNVPTFQPATEVVQAAEVITPVTRTTTTSRTDKLFPKEADRTIHSWALDQEFLTGSVVSHADESSVMLPDGSVQFGADPRDAIADGVDKQVKDWIHHITDTDQRRIVVGEAYSDAGATRRIEPGTELRSGEFVYDAKGNQIEYDDPDVFKHLEPDSTPVHIHDNWGMVGPLLRDGADVHHSTSRMVRDTRPFRSASGRRTPWVRADEAARQAKDVPKIRRYRAHWTQMRNAPHAPKVVVAPALREINRPNKFSRIVERGFEQGISPAIDAIVRRPLAFHYFTEALTENDRALRWMYSKHLFGDEQAGTAGALHDKFADVLNDPVLARDVQEIADEVLTATRVLEPHIYNELADLEPIDIINAYYGRYGDDVVAHAEIGQALGAATRKMQDARRELIIDRIVQAGPRTSLRRSLKAVQQQTETPMTRLMSVAHDRRKPVQNLGWVPFDANRVQPGSMVVDVPTSEVSSSMARLNKHDFRTGLEVEGLPTPVRHTEAEAFEKIAQIDDRDVVEGMLEWIGTGKRPAGWENVTDITFDKLSKQMKDLRVDTDTFEMLGQYTFGEWQEAADAAKQVLEFPRWSLDVRNNPRPVEGILDAYEAHLDEYLDLSWDEVQRHLSVLPSQLRQPLDEDAWNVLSSSYKNRKHATQTSRELAAQRAVVNAMPYLDSHELRSQAGEYVRGFFPFMYAEENFLKRWARTIKVAPDAIRRGQLVYAGLKSGGVVRTDVNGRDYVVYPGFGVVADVVNRSTQAMGFGDAVLPTGVVFQSETKNLLPGFDVERTGMASANPPLAIALGALSNKFHELRPIQRGLVGDAGVSQGGIQQFVPSTARRLWRVMQTPEESNVAYASAMMNAITVLEHNGHGLPENATKNQLDDYNRRVMNHTRGILAVQAFAGFIVPGSPQIAFTGESGLDMSNLTGLGAEMPADIFRPQFLQLVQELGIEEGTIEYFKQNPDHDLYDLMPFTVGQSRSSSGAPLPVTHEAVAWADDNNGWLEQYPNAGAWMLPQPDPNDEGDFDQYAYVQQAISGLRQKRTPTEFLEALKYKEGAHDYFRSQDKYEEMRAATDDPMVRRQLRDTWETYKSQHYASHPVFQEMLQGSKAQQRRQKVIEELSIAIDDPATPDVAHKQPLSDLLRVFNQYKLQYSLMSEGRDAESIARADQFKAYYQDWVDRWLMKHPTLEPFWLSVLRPESNL